jgi:hypothetical protein
MPTVAKPSARSMLLTVFGDVVLPSGGMAWLTTLSQAMSLFLRSGYSRIPVIGESSDDIKGLLYLKDAEACDYAPDPVELDRFQRTLFALWRAIGGTRDWLPFVLTLCLFLLTMIGLAISIWPDVIPGRVSIWQAAAPEQSQLFMLIGALVLIPLILAYTAWSYWVFRGKVGEEGYHAH